MRESPSRDVGDASCWRDFPQKSGWIGSIRQTHQMRSHRRWEGGMPCASHAAVAWVFRKGLLRLIKLTQRNRLLISRITACWYFACYKRSGDTWRKWYMVHDRTIVCCSNQHDRSCMKRSRRQPQLSTLTIDRTTMFIRICLRLFVHRGILRVDRK